MIGSIDVRVRNGGSLSIGTFPVSSASSMGRHIQIVSLATGTSISERINSFLLDSKHNSALHLLEQNVEDAVDDDSEEVWRTFLDMEPHYHTTNRWLAES